MEATYRLRGIRFALGNIGTSHRRRSPFRFRACVVSLVVIVASLTSVCTNGQAQDVDQDGFNEWQSADGSVRMISLWDPVPLRRRYDEWAEYVVVKNESGETLIHFSIDVGFLRDPRKGVRGLYGVYSVSQSKLVYLSDLRGDDRRVIPEVSRNTRNFYKLHVVEDAAETSCFYQPPPKDYTGEVPEYVLDYEYEGRRGCDPHAAAIYPAKTFDRKEGGRVLIRINKRPRMRPSHMPCWEWGSERDQVVFIEAVTPFIFKLPDGGLVLGDSNYPTFFINSSAETIADFSFCIGTFDFVYTIIDADDLAKIIRNVEARYQDRRSRGNARYFSYANSVQKNIELMHEVVSSLGDCPKSTAPRKRSD